MNNINLVGFHGGILGYDLETSSLKCYRDGIPIGIYEVLFDGKNIFIQLNDSKKYIFFLENKFSLTDNLQEVNLIVHHHGYHLNIKIENKYLSCRSDLNIVNGSDKPLGWEEFYLKFNDYVDTTEKFHYSDLFEYNKLTQPKSIEKNIWLYWDSNPPPLINKIVKKLENLNPGYEITLINKDNIRDYTEYDLFKDDMNPTFRSDLLRLILLYNYGGFWIDASTLTNTSINNITGLNQYNQTHYELIGFYRKCHFIHDLPCVESWFLGSPKGSFIIGKWLEVLLEALYSSPEALLEKLKQDINFEKIKNTYSEGSFLYFLAYLCQQKVFIDYKKYMSIQAFCADYSAFYFKDRHGWSNPDRYINLLFSRENEIIFLPKIIKFTKGDRDLFEKIRAEKRFKTYSYLGNYI